MMEFANDVANRGKPFLDKHRWFYDTINNYAKFVLIDVNNYTVHLGTYNNFLL